MRIIQRLFCSINNHLVLFSVHIVIHITLFVKYILHINVNIFLSAIFFLFVHLVTEKPGSPEISRAEDKNSAGMQPLRCWFLNIEIRFVIALIGTPVSVLDQFLAGQNAQNFFRLTVPRNKSGHLFIKMYHFLMICLCTIQ